LFIEVQEEKYESVSSLSCFTLHSIKKIVEKFRSTSANAIKVQITAQKRVF